MSTELKEPLVVFPNGFDDRAEFEAQCKGFLADVEVNQKSGCRYRLFFIDPARLGQDLEERVKWGKPYLAEPNMVVVPQVTAAAIQAAVAALAADGSFAYLKPLE